MYIYIIEKRLNNILQVRLVIHRQNNNNRGKKTSYSK